MNWEKLFSNISFTAENLQEAGHIKMMNEIFHFLKFQEFINELGKICFPLGKTELIGFWTHWKFGAYSRIFDPGKIPTNTLTLYIHANINPNR